MENSRVTKSIKNTGFGMLGMTVNLLVQFISRALFIKLLGDAYNGINGLFTNILYVLNLAELGFAHSIAFALYGPLQEANEEKICAIMNHLRKIYYVVAIAVAVAGLACVPFLQHLISEDISELPFALNQIRVYFLIYLGNTVFSYVWSYKRTLISADQRAYVISNADNLSNILLYIVQIVLLLVWKSYYLYLILMVSKTILTNVVLSLIADKRYPYLWKNRRLKIDDEERKGIFKNVSALVFHKFGAVIIYGTTTIIISAFIGVIEAGWYANYLLIVHGVNAVINIIYNSITASVGNLCVTEDTAQQRKVFDRTTYATNAMVVLAFTCYVVLFNDFIRIWVGEKTFSLSVVVVIAANATLYILRNATSTFKTAKGLFVQDWYKSIVEAATGVLSAIAFSYLWGVFGVIFGYTLASFVIAMPIENVVLYKHGFHAGGKPLAMQFLRLLWAIAQAAAFAALAYFICSFLPEGLLWFALKAVIAVAISAGGYVLLSFRSDGFRYYKNMAFGMLKKLFKKKVK
ncbi:MAG: hypothetical protein IJX30_04430 [Clostridia bacterium]|nr:hypothetical protein [Clostridia bacterium]